MGNSRDKGGECKQKSPIKRKIEQLKRLAIGSSSGNCATTSPVYNRAENLNIKASITSRNETNVIETSTISSLRVSSKRPSAGPSVSLAGDDFDQASSIDVAYEHPTKISHGFWLQRYLRLHQDAGGEPMPVAELKLAPKNALHDTAAGLGMGSSSPAPIACSSAASADVANYRYCKSADSAAKRPTGLSTMPADENGAEQTRSRSLLSRCRNLVVRHLGHQDRRARSSSESNRKQATPTTGTATSEPLNGTASKWNSQSALPKSQQLRPIRGDHIQSGGSWIVRHLSGSPIRAKRDKTSMNEAQNQQPKQQQQSQQAEPTTTIADTNQQQLKSKSKFESTALLLANPGDDNDNNISNIDSINTNRNELETDSKGLGTNLIEAARTNVDDSNISKAASNQRPSAQVCEQHETGKQSPYKRFTSTVMIKFALNVMRSTQTQTHGPDKWAHLGLERQHPSGTAINEVNQASSGQIHDRRIKSEGDTESQDMRATDRSCSQVAKPHRKRAKRKKLVVESEFEFELGHKGSKKNVANIYSQLERPSKRVNSNGHCNECDTNSTEDQTNIDNSNKAQSLGLRVELGPNIASVRERPNVMSDEIDLSCKFPALSCATEGQTDICVLNQLDQAVQSGQQIASTTRLSTDIVKREQVSHVDRDEKQTQHNPPQRTQPSSVEVRWGSDSIESGQLVQVEQQKFEAILSDRLANENQLLDCESSIQTLCEQIANVSQRSTTLDQSSEQTLVSSCTQADTVLVSARIDSTSTISVAASQPQRPERPEEQQQPQPRVHIAFREPSRGGADQDELQSQSQSQSQSDSIKHKARRQDSSGSDRQQANKQSSGRVGTQLATNFKRLIRRQQSVDSYRMARELKNKIRRQQEADSRSMERTSARNSSGSHAASKQARAAANRHGESFIAATKRKASVCADSLARARVSANFIRPAWISQTQTQTIASQQQQQQQPSAKIEFKLVEPTNDDQANNNAKSSATKAATPPSSLKLSAFKNPKESAMSKPALHSRDYPGAFVVGSFSGSITPTYPTHHLPSLHYVSSPPKKYSDASTISSSIGGYDSSSAAQNANQTRPTDTRQQPAEINEPEASNVQPSTQSDTDTSMTTPLPQSQCKLLENKVNQSDNSNCPKEIRDETVVIADVNQHEASLLAKRAYLAEHIYDNKCGLGEDMKYLACLPELCDITFLVGETREPVCAVKSVLAARSRVFHKILFGNRSRRIEYSQMSYQGESIQTNDDNQPSTTNDNNREQKKLFMGRKSPNSRSNTPTSQQYQQNKQQWSVTLDASGYSGGGGGSGGSPIGGNSSATPTTRSGRFSSSSGRESNSSRKDSREPLIVGPGQTATTAKRSKKTSVRDSGQQSGRRLSRIFLKRISDSSIKRHHYSAQSSHQHQLQHNNSLSSIGSHSNNPYLDKMSKSQTSSTMIIDEFEPDVFRQLIEYIHTGCVLLQARTLLGLLNAADYYGLEQLRKACLRFVSCCITVDTVCSLLATAERYIQYKCTKSIVQKVLEFVDNHADEIFKLNAFGLLPEHVVRLILSRDGLQADELVKYNGVYNWCEHYCRSYELTNIADVMRNFLDLIQFHKIPTNALLTQIYPSHIVPDTIFLSALAYQVDPSRFEPQPMQLRRMTLPNPVIYKRFGSEDEQDEEEEKHKSKPNDKLKSRELGSNQHLLTNGDERPYSVDSGSNAKTSGRKLASPGQHSDMANERGTKFARFRKGSIAQVSISGMMRLSHKLSIKRRQPHQSRGRFPSLSRKSPTVVQSEDKENDPNDPIQLGRQILDQYLDEQRQREIENEQAREKEATPVESANPNVSDGETNLASSSSTTGPGNGDGRNPSNQDSSTSSIKHPLTKASSTRKSFKDFRHISKRIFSRHSSSKQLKSQQSDSFNTTNSPNQTIENREKEKRNHDVKNRNRFKIKRSETVIETNPASNKPDY